MFLRQNGTDSELGKKALGRISNPPPGARRRGRHRGERQNSVVQAHLPEGHLHDLREGVAVQNVGDGVAIFEEPTLRDWAILVDMEKKTLEQQAELLIPKLKELRGFQYKDGTDVTVEDIRNRKFSAKFFLQLMTAWTRAIVEGLRGDSEEKKDQPTVN
jgi:hypothetical protein